MIKKIKNEFLLENNLTTSDSFYSKIFKYIKSDYYKKTNDYNPDNIQLIYKGEILEQYHIEADEITLEDFEKDNNINVVIVKHDENNSNISSGSD